MEEIPTLLTQNLQLSAISWLSFSIAPRSQSLRLSQFSILLAMIHSILAILITGDLTVLIPKPRKTMKVALHCFQEKLKPLKQVSVALYFVLSATHLLITLQRKLGAISTSSSIEIIQSHQGRETSSEKKLQSSPLPCSIVAEQQGISSLPMLAIFSALTIRIS